MGNERHSGDTAPLAPLRSRATQRGLLTLYLSYRVVLALLLAGLPLSGMGPALLGSHAPGLYLVVSLLYLGISVLALLLFRTGPLDVENTSHVAIFSDILCIILMLHASGGITTGLGILLAISIALGGLTANGRATLLFAALASLAVLSESLYSHLHGDFPHTAYTQAGLLGAVFFALALLTHFLTRRIRESEQLARQRGIDLANLTELNQLVIAQMQTGVLVLDARQRILLSNDAARRLLHRPGPLRGRPLQAVDTALADEIASWAPAQQSANRRFRPDSGGTELQVRLMSIGQQRHQGTLVFLDDAGRLISQAQQMKLASLGRLTASIAHEIRNPLGAISHAAQLLLESDGLDATDRRMAEIIGGNAQRLNLIVENVLNLTRRQAMPVPIELPTWLLDWAREARQAYRLDAGQLDVRPDVALDHIEADPAQLRQVLDILVENAHAHFPGDKDDLRLQVSSHGADETRAAYLEITDNGPGIGAAQAEQIFEPFFTTQARGTGLGLYIAQQMSEANQMTLEYVPREQGGACFRLYLPRQGESP